MSDWYRRVPKKYSENLKFRRWLIRECQNNPEMREAVWRACRADILFFINCFIFQFNPLIGGTRTVGPFLTWTFQDEILAGDRGILWCYQNRRTGVVEKSREMGASWLFQIFQVWLAMFHRDVQLLNISRSADAVDCASRNSLFAKVRFMLEHIPDWLKGPIDDQKFNIKFLRTCSEITGEASTGRAGTGGRATVVFVDEYSEIKEDVKVRQNTASVTDCRFFNGTHLGVGTEFYNMTQSPEFVQIQIHWTRHPRKNKHLYSWDADDGKPRFWAYDRENDEIVEQLGPASDFPEDYPFDQTGNPSGGPHPGIRSPWYDKKAGEIGSPRQVAMELDINPTGSSSQFYDAMVIRKLFADCRDPYWEGDIAFESATADPTRIDPETDGPLKMWIEPGLDPKGRLCHVTPSEYVIAADIGTGVGATPTCFSIFDGLRGLKIAKYIHHWKDPKQMAWIAVALCKLFKDSRGNPAFLAWESAGPGIMFGNEILKEINFRNIYWKTEMFKDEERQTDTPGWHPSQANKLQLHTEYRSALRSGEFANFDRSALAECLNYIYNPDGSVDHPKAKKNNEGSGIGQNHGDNVVADALAWLMAKRQIMPMATVNAQAITTPDSILGRRMLRKRIEREKLIWS